MNQNNTPVSYFNTVWCPHFRVRLGFRIGRLPQAEKVKIVKSFRLAEWEELAVEFLLTTSKRFIVCT